MYFSCLICFSGKMAIQRYDWSDHLSIKLTVHYPAYHTATHQINKYLARNFYLICLFFPVYYLKAPTKNISQIFSEVLFAPLWNERARDPNVVLPNRRHLCATLELFFSYPDERLHPWPKDYCLTVPCEVDFTFTSHMRYFFFLFFYWQPHLIVHYCHHQVAWTRNILLNEITNRWNIYV